MSYVVGSSGNVRIEDVDEGEGYPAGVFERSLTRKDVVNSSNCRDVERGFDEWQAGRMVGLSTCVDCALPDRGGTVFSEKAGRCPSCLSTRFVPADKLQALILQLRERCFRVYHGRIVSEFVWHLAVTGSLEDLVERGVEEAEMARTVGRL